MQIRYMENMKEGHNFNKKVNRVENDFNVNRLALNENMVFHTYIFSENSFLNNT